MISWYSGEGPAAGDWRLVARTQTDAAGNFQFEGRWHRRFWLPLPADPLVEWRLEARDGDRTVGAWEEGIVSLGTPARLDLACELSGTAECTVLDTEHPYATRRWPSALKPPARREAP